MMCQFVYSLLLTVQAYSLLSEPVLFLLYKWIIVCHIIAVERIEVHLPGAVVTYHLVL